MNKYINYDITKKELMYKYIQITNKNNNISTNPRTLDRYMQKLNLHFLIRQAKRKCEIKNTNVKFLNIANREMEKLMIFMQLMFHTFPHQKM